MRQIKPEQIDRDVFDLIGKDWMLVGAQKRDGSVNAMTASWGGLGVLWGKPVAFVFVRPQRYTKTFLDEADTMSLSFFDESRRDMLTYMGKTSGRDEDKIAASGLRVAHSGDTPYFEQARMTLIGNKRYVQDMRAECFVDDRELRQWYPDGDLHTVYVIEIDRVLLAD